MGPEDVGEEFFDLWAAKTPDDLRRVLVLYPPVRRSSNAFEPYQLLSKHHRIDPSSSAVTAMLMVTDVRWRNGAGNLMRQIEESGIVDDGELDLLAEAFLAAGDALFWEVPDEWFDGGIVIALDEADQQAVDEVVEEADDDEQPTVARRPVYPPLRRWAAGRLVRRRPARWAEVFSRARHLNARDATATVSGLLDAIAVLGPDSQEFLIAEAVRWPQQSVRRQGMGLVAERATPDAGNREEAAAVAHPAPAPAPKQRPAPPTLF